MDHIYMEGFIVILVFAYLILFVFESTLDDEARDSLYLDLLFAELVILSLFMVEIVLKIYAHGIAFLRVCANSFDALIIVLSFGLSILAIVMHDNADNQLKDSSVDDGTVLARLLRFRVFFRVLRLVILLGRVKRGARLLDTVLMDKQRDRRLQLGPVDRVLVRRIASIRNWPRASQSRFSLFS